jgi:hypothetical protein
LKGQHTFDRSKVFSISAEYNMRVQGLIEIIEKKMIDQDE